MTVYAAPGAPIYPSVQWGATGATLGVRIRRNTDGTDVVARTTTGIVESPAGSGIYVAQTTGLIAPTTQGDIYDIVWDDGTATVSGWATEDLVVTSSSVATVAPSGTDLCALAEVKLQAGITSSSDDSLIASLIVRASREIERWCQRELAPRAGTATRRFEVRTRHVDLAPSDLLDATMTVQLYSDTASPVTLTRGTDFILLPRDGAPGSTAAQRTFTRLRLSRWQVIEAAQDAMAFGSSELSVLGTWGLAAVPDDVRHAAIITTAAWLDRSVGEYAMQSMVDDPRNVQPQGVGLAIPLDAKRALDPYRRAPAP